MNYKRVEQETGAALRILTSATSSATLQVSAIHSTHSHPSYSRTGNDGLKALERIRIQPLVAIKLNFNIGMQHLTVASMRLRCLLKH